MPSLPVGGFGAVVAASSSESESSSSPYLQWNNNDSVISKSGSQTEAPLQALEN